MTNKDKQKSLSRRGFLGALGAKSAIAMGAGSLVIGCKDDEELDCDPASSFDAVITGEVVDGTAEDWSPTTGAKREMIPSACWQCVSRDGIVCYVEDGQLKKIEGNPALRRTGGKLCARGQGGVGQVYDPDRLLFPMRRTGARGSHQWERISWTDAMAELAEKVGEARNIDPKYFFLHYGRMKASSSKIAKDYFLKGLGSKSYAGHTAICEAAKWTAQELVWGKHYDVNDIEHSQVIVNFGCNMLATHTSHIPFAQRLSKALHEGAELYTFDPRLSETAGKSTKWLPVKPGTDLAIILAMAYHIITNDLMPQEGIDFINDWTNIDAGGFTDRVEALRDLLENPDAYIADFLDADGEASAYWRADDQPSGGYTPAWAAELSGVPAADIEAIAEAYATTSPGSTIVTYRGAVMHFNGVNAERAALMLEGMCGNIDAVGGRVHAVGAKWNSSSTYPTPSNSQTGLKLQNDSAYVAPTHHASHQVLHEIKKADPADRPMVYFVYCYTPAYANGDMQESIDILKDTTLIPYMVVSDVAYSEAAMYADLLLPDTTYLERWDWEDMVSYNQIQEWYIRQPVITPLGEVKNTQDVFIELAGMLSTGGDDPLEQCAAVGSMENFVKAACLDTAAVDAAGKAAGYADGYEFMKKVGAYWDPSETPTYGTYDETVDVTPVDPDSIADDDENEYIFQDENGVVWETTKAHFNDGYVNTSSAYKYYVGQAIDDSGTIYKGFSPDKANKSGWFELDSLVMKAKHYPGLPVWMPIPEHEAMAAGELILTTFKMPSQTHSRTQNCKYLTELDHAEPAWINATTAAGLGISDGDMVKVTRTMELYNDKEVIETIGTNVSSITVRCKVVQGIRPDVIAISHHFGHWAYGRYASGEGNPMASDPDQVEHAKLDEGQVDEIWWDESGWRGNWIMPNAGDPISGAMRCMDTVVRVEPA